MGQRHLPSSRRIGGTCTSTPAEPAARTGDSASEIENEDQATAIHAPVEDILEPTTLVGVLLAPPWYRPKLHPGLAGSVADAVGIDPKAMADLGQ